MKKIPVENAVGMALCHDITAMRDGFKGAAFRRGHVITEEDIPKLVNALCYGDGRKGSISGFVTLNEEDCTNIYRMMVR